MSPESVTLIINEYLADPPLGLAGDANGDGVRDPTQDEFVEIVNNGTSPVNVGSFTISDASSTRFTFPSGKVIPPGEAAVVFGGGTPTGSFGNASANGLVFAAGGSGLSLSNSGDTITIKDNLGTVVTSLTYTTTPQESVTRSPDITGSFVSHSMAAGSGGSHFSPGTRVNGAPFTTTDPVIASISPSGTIVGGGDVSLTVIGMNFHGGAQVRVDGTAVFSAVFSDSEIDAQIPGSMLAVPGSRAITVQNPGGAISNSVPFTVLAEIGINEYLADPPDGLAGDANGDGVRDSSQDEFVELINRTNFPFDVGGYTISDADALRFTLPFGTVIPANEVAVIFGGGTPQGDFGNTRANGLLFTAALSLNNTGDTITLKNAGGAVVESITYGSSEGNANQSINRNPDGSGVTFAGHSAIPGSGGRLFSPGARVDGSPFTVGPHIASIIPNTAALGSPPFDVTVQGTGFDGGSVVLIDGAPVSTAFIAAGKLAGRVPSSVLGVTGPHSVQVRNDGGNRSNLLTLTVIAPGPTLASITPRVITVGSPAFTIILSGANFLSGSTMLIDNTSVTTTFIGASELRALVPASFFTSAGTRQVVVRNPDGKVSNPLTLEVIGPATVLASISPTTAIVGSPGFVMSLRGSNFKSGIVVFFDQTLLVTRFLSATDIEADVPAQLLTAIGGHAISVQNPGEFLSNELLFQVLPDSPIITSIDPPTVIAGRGDLIVTIVGQKFNSAAVAIVIDATHRAGLETTVISSQRLQAKVLATFTASPKNLLLQVVNPDTGQSNAATLRVLINDPLVINEYLADPPTGIIGDANGDGTRSSSQDEFIEILNRSADPIDISGYKLLDADAVRHVFPAGTVIPPFEVTVVFGGGTPTGAFGNAAENNLVFKASTGGLSLNNGGDNIILQDAQGRVVQQIAYGPSEGGAGQSINRDPDGDGATFTLHTIVAADPTRLFSPGTKAAGPTFTIKPFIRTVTPASIHVGSPDFSLDVSGGNFVPGAVVLVNGTAMDTVFHSDTQLEARVARALLSEGGALDVRVKNPRGELSSPAHLLVVDDPPKITQIAPQKVSTGADGFEVTITGERFQRGAAVTVQGTSVAVRFVSSSALVITLPGDLLSKAAELQVIVGNADGNKSNVVTLTVENGPLITRLSRNKIRAGRGVFEITIGGVAFKPGIVLFVNDTPVSTTFVSDSEFTARIPAEFTSAAGVLLLQARDADGGRSNIAKLKVIE